MDREKRQGEPAARMQVAAALFRNLAAGSGYGADKLTRMRLGEFHPHRDEGHFVAIGGGVTGLRGDTNRVAGLDVEAEIHSALLRKDAVVGSGVELCFAANFLIGEPQYHIDNDPLLALCVGMSCVVSIGRLALKRFTGPGNDRFSGHSEHLNDKNDDPAVLKASRSTHSQLVSHAQAQVERSGMDNQTLENVIVPSEVSPSHAAGFIQVREGPLYLLASLLQQPFAARSPNPPPISVHRGLLDLFAIPVALAVAPKANPPPARQFHALSRFPRSSLTNNSRRK